MVLFNSIRLYKSVFNWFIFYDILQTINILNKKLHSTIDKAITPINEIIQIFENIRNFTQFSLKHNISIETPDTDSSYRSFYVYMY